MLSNTSVCERGIMGREEHRHCLISDNEKLPALNLSKMEIRGINQTTETNKCFSCLVYQAPLMGAGAGELLATAPEHLCAAAVPALVCFNSPLPLTLL